MEAKPNTPLCECPQLMNAYSRCRAFGNPDCSIPLARWLLCTQRNRRPELYQQASSCLEGVLQNFGGKDLSKVDLSSCQPQLNQLTEIALSEVEELDSQKISTRDSRVLEKCSSLIWARQIALESHGPESVEYKEASAQEMDCFLEGCCLKERRAAYECINNDPTGGERCVEHVEAARDALAAFLSRTMLEADDDE